MASCHGQVSSLLHGAAVPATVRSAHPSAPPHPPTPHLLFIDAVLQLPGARLVLTVVIINQTGPHVQKLRAVTLAQGLLGGAPRTRGHHGVVWLKSAGSMYCAAGGRGGGMRTCQRAELPGGVKVRGC